MDERENSEKNIDISITSADSQKDTETAKTRQTAIAVKNDLSNGQELPKITAIGHGALAEKILQIAFEQGVKVRQDADLVELLAAVELDHEIPPEAIMAVAEILVRVYQANGKMEQLKKAKES